MYVRVRMQAVAPVEHSLQEYLSYGPFTILDTLSQGIVSSKETTHRYHFELVIEGVDRRTDGIQKGVFIKPRALGEGIEMSQ